MASLGKLAKVNESITINRYDNGWMVEIGGRNKKEDWSNTKTLCNTEDEVCTILEMNFIIRNTINDRNPRLLI